jgi:hypothetical protein
MWVASDPRTDGNIAEYAHAALAKPAAVHAAR